MNNKIKCIICNKDIKDNDEIILGSKDDYLTLPDDVKSSDVVFLHSDCLKKYLEEKKND